MDILLAYSRRHFDPAQPEQSTGSAGSLARAWYELLSRYGKVDYVDGLAPPCRLKRQHYDLLVGIQGAVSPLKRIATFDRTILFAVNMHPVERNARLMQFWKTTSVCSKRHLLRNRVSLRVLEDYQQVDAVFLVGNRTVEQSFLSCGIPQKKLYCFNYASSLALGKPIGQHRLPHLLYTATEMCLRKGADLVIELLTWALEEGYLFHVDIIGQVLGEYKDKITELQEKLGENLSVHGWVDAASTAYRELLQKNDFILFPSLEEGQAGSVLDALSQGLVPLVTRETGISHAPLGWLESRMFSQRNREIIRRALSLASSERLALQAGVCAYYVSEHVPWKQRMAEALDDFLHDRSQQRQAPTSPEVFSLPRFSWWARNLGAPLARVGSYLSPSRQGRKQLDNYWRLSRFLPHD